MFLLQLKKTPAAKGNDAQPGSSTDGPQNGEEKDEIPEDICNYYEKLDHDEDDEEEEGQLKTVSFEINQENVEDVQRKLVTTLNLVINIITVRHPERKKKKLVQLKNSKLCLDTQNKNIYIYF